MSSVKHAKLRSRTKISIIDNSMSTGQHISVPSSSLAIKDTTNIGNVNLLLCVHRNPRSVSINLVVKLRFSKRIWWRQLILCVQVQMLKIWKYNFKEYDCRQGCLCFGICGPHQCSADSGKDTCTKQALYHMPGWLTLAEQVQAPYHARVLKTPVRPCAFFSMFLVTFFSPNLRGPAKKNKMSKEKKNALAQCSRPPDRRITHLAHCVERSHSFFFFLILFISKRW